MAAYQSVLFQGLLQCPHGRTQYELLRLSLVQIVDLDIIVFRFYENQDVRSNHEPQLAIFVVKADEGVGFRNRLVFVVSCI